MEAVRAAGGLKSKRGSKAHQIRNPKAEIRTKSEDRNPKTRTPSARAVSDTARFGFRVSDFFRISGFGFRIFIILIRASDFGFRVSAPFPACAGTPPPSGSLC